MKKKSILNRAMFRQVKSPAYGTGISANLVSDEQRQRYNYGGRVGLVGGTGDKNLWDIKPKYPPSNPWQGPRNEYWTQTNLPDGVFPPKGRGQSEYLYDEIDYEEGLPKNLATMDYNIEGVSSKPYKIGELGVYGTGSKTQKRGDIFGSGYIGQGTGLDTVDELEKEHKYSVDISDMSLEEAQDIGRESDWWKMQKGDVFAMEPTHDEKTGEDTGYKYLEADTWVDDKGNLRSQKDLSDEEKIVMQEKFKEGKSDDARWEPGVQHEGLPGDEIDPSGMPQPPKFEETETLDISSIIDKYYDKKGSLGAAQLGLAGQILKAGFQPKKDAMGTVGDAMGQFGKDISADKKAFEKLAATGEIQRELYRMSRAEEGKQDRATKAYGVELEQWLKKNGVEEKEISNINKYNNSIKNWGGTEGLTGEQHQNLIAGFDEEFAEKSIVINPVVTGIGKDQVTKFSAFDQKQLDDAEEGDPIIIGGDVYIKDSNAQNDMRVVGYASMKLTKNKKPKKKDKALSAAGI